MPGKTKTMQILASGCGSAAFCYLFGGSAGDSAAAFAAGVALYAYILYVSGPHFSKLSEIYQEAPGYHYLQPDVSFGGRESI